jgi:hypothetical protein
MIMNDSTFISRSIKTSLIVGAILFIVTIQVASLEVIWGGAIGILASVFNLYILSLIAKTLWVSPSDLSHHQKKAGLLYAVLKFPFFYGLLIFILLNVRLSAYAFMAGFSLPLVVIVLKSVGKVYVENNLQRGLVSGQ